MRKIMLSTSILDSNFADIRTTIKMLDRAKVEFIHFDVMDGNFVPNITFGPKIIKPLRPLTTTPFDTHLMILNPEKYIDDFLQAGSDIITVHQESRGKKVGFSIKPGTPAEVLYKYIDRIDLILVMSVEPGFGGQKFMEPVLNKVREYRDIVDKNKYDCLIEIDGGINKETAPLACAAGADILVSGSAIFGSKNPFKSIKELRNAVK
jgi:ribulose-phosphate 3-epimerase